MTHQAIRRDLQTFVERRLQMAFSHSKTKIALGVLAACLISYGILAYIVLPLTWTHYDHQRKLAGVAMLTRTGQGIQGDPINVGLVGTKDDVICAMHAAAWYPADPITFRSSLEIIGSVVLRQPYQAAPVSNLFYDNRREDFWVWNTAGRRAGE